ncbi:hypothetical protein [Pantoea dispersa]|uniref:hypothetical protein n=1 Tax=Pantoea dispersa TaxID=59814 RepID=UPI0021F6A956|nr:hypothetical protein [Pantoea dispersa]MCW0320123.1 hypothetical protein [Pantoea dispersa]MCW0324859.1 hypothetical protein [Pantoea dispersa]MCW0431413.1 hypothetical protein [Pantoea dispersa]
MTSLLDEVKAKVKLEAINLIESSIKFGKDVNFINISGFETKSQHFNGISRVETFSLNSSDGDDSRYFGYFYHYSVGNRLILKDIDENDAKAASEGTLNVVRATFGALYVSDCKLSREEIIELGKNTVGNDVWPNWREYLQSSCVRMGIQPETLPNYDFNDVDLRLEDLE